MQRGQTALHAASQQGIMDSVRILLRVKANVNAVDEVHIQVFFMESGCSFLVVLCFSVYKVAIKSTRCLYTGRMHTVAYGCFNESTASGKVVATSKS